MVCHNLARFGGHRYCSSRNIILFVCHLIKQDREIKVSGDCNDASPSSHHRPAKFGGHRQCRSRDTMVLLCHMIYEDHVIKGSSAFIGNTLKLTSYHGHRHSDSGDILVFDCLMILQDHVITTTYDFMVKSPSSYATILPRLVVIGTVIVKI